MIRELQEYSKKTPTKCAEEDIIYFIKAAEFGIRVRLDMHMSLVGATKEDFPFECSCCHVLRHRSDFFDNGTFLSWLIPLNIKKIKLCERQNCLTWLQFPVEAGIDAVAESIKRGWRYQVGRNCLNWPWVTAGAGELRSPIWGTGCNVEPAAFHREIGQMHLSWEEPQILLESQSHISQLAQCMSKGFQLFLFQSICVLFPQAELWTSGLDFHLD